MTTLYELNVHIEDIERNMIDMETGEINEDALTELDNLELDKKQKVDNIACLIKSLEAEAKAIRDEAKSNIENRAIPRENKANRLRDYLANNCNGEVYETERSKVSWRPSKRVELVKGWEKILPDKYINCKITTNPDKAGLQKALKAGEKINGASLVESMNLQIK